MIRDYNKEPIIIKDKFYLTNKYSWYLNIFAMVTIFVVIVLNFKSQNPNVLGMSMYAVLTIALVKEEFKKISKYKNSYIYFYNDSISRIDTTNNSVIENIKTNDIKNIYRTIGLTFFKNMSLFQKIKAYFAITACSAYIYMLAYKGALPMVVFNILFIFAFLFWFNRSFAYRFISGLNLKVLRDAIVINSKDISMDIVCLSSDELNEIKEYLSKRTRFKI